MPHRSAVPLALLAIVASITAWSAAAIAQAPARRPPNIVVILADDLGYGDLGVQGCRDVATPHIDSIAADGVRFTDGYVTCPVCAPTRAGLLTGRYQQRFGLELNPGPEASAAANYGLPRDQPTLAERLRAGTGDLHWATGMVGKWHLGYQRELQPMSRGFESFFGFLSGANDYLKARESTPILRGFEPVEETDYLTTAFAREAVAFIDAHHERPFFLYVPFNAVHAPLQARDEDRARFPDVTAPKRLTYAAMLAALDDAVGAILGALAEHGLEKDTLVVFLSDNGGPTQQTTSRNDPLRGVKGQVFEGGIRIPFLMRWPGTLPAGRVEHRPVISLDVVPTVLAAAGVPVRDGPDLDGVDLLPFLTGPRDDRPHETLFWRFGAQSAVRHGDLKLVRRDDTTALFDLAADIGEAHDLAAERPDDVAALSEAFAAWETGTMAARWVRSARARQGGQPAPARPRNLDALENGFDRLDRDGDGRLSREEAARYPRLFRQLDADGDGFLTRDELRRRDQAR
ncbi:MAG: sulfatase-like hydrolase/transferase [Planctomycetes bacterium]|nr:sulfatase-like hydrolase/transferase [Planctomycetota bacterium]